VDKEAIMLRRRDKEETGVPLAADAPADADAAGSAGVDRSETKWQEELSPERYAVLRKAATEPAFTGQYWDCHDDGVYRCAACGATLFTSDTKFDSGSGWPSFTEPAVAEAVTLHRDASHFMVRTEVRCRRCGSHLGHLFDDGPAPSHQRFCVNSLALELDPNASNTEDSKDVSSGNHEGQ
jgi:peptide-methionine (R)-S-oxide reductase